MRKLVFASLLSTAALAFCLAAAPPFKPPHRGGAVAIQKPIPPQPQPPKIDTVSVTVFGQDRVHEPIDLQALDTAGIEYFVDDQQIMQLESLRMLDGSEHKFLVPARPEFMIQLPPRIQPRDIQPPCGNNMQSASIQANAQAASWSCLGAVNCLGINGTPCNGVTGVTITYQEVNGSWVEVGSDSQTYPSAKCGMQAALSAHVRISNPKVGVTYRCYWQGYDGSRQLWSLPADFTYGA